MQRVSESSVTITLAQIFESSSSLVTRRPAWVIKCCSRAKLFGRNAISISPRRRHPCETSSVNSPILYRSVDIRIPCPSGQQGRQRVILPVSALLRQFFSVPSGHASPPERQISRSAAVGNYPNRGRTWIVRLSHG